MIPNRTGEGNGRHDQECVAPCLTRKTNRVESAGSQDSSTRQVRRTFFGEKILIKQNQLSAGAIRYFHPKKYLQNPYH